MTPDELVAQVSAIHNRCRDYAHAAADEFELLGERLYAEIYDQRARDIEHQRDRHIRIIRGRVPSPPPCTVCGQTPTVITSADGTIAGTLLACACADGPAP